MIRHLLLGIGLVGIVEGLVLALLPGHMQRVLDAVARLAPEERRLIGLLAVTVGIALVWAGKA